jgi:hypothetical protein
MFATFTDWSMADPEEFSKTAKEIWPSMKAAGALSMRIVKTNDRGARTMTIWPDIETAQIAIEAITAIGTSQAGTKAVGGAKGAVLAEFE